MKGSSDCETSLCLLRDRIGANIVRAHAHCACEGGRSEN